MVKCNGPQQASQDARELRQRACELARDIKTLESIEGAALLAGKRQAEAARLKEPSLDLLERGGWSG